MWPISSFSEVLRCLSQLSTDEVKAGQSSIESPVLPGRFLVEIRIRCLISPSQHLSAPIRTIFASLLGVPDFPPHPVTVLSTTAQLEATLATAPA